MATGLVRKLELFIACCNISRCDERLFDSFAVLSVKTPDQAGFEEVDRTETMTQCMSPAYCTSMVLDYDELQMPWTQVRVDVYERLTLHTERLRDHLHRCTATTTVADLLHAPSMQFTAQLYHPADERKVGILYMMVEHVDVSKNGRTEGGADLASTVKLDITATLLRRRDWNKTVMNQRYELCRMHRYADDDGNAVWIPVYRSDRMGRPRDHQSGGVEFATAQLSMRHFCNGDEQRNMRLVFYAQAPEGKKPLLKRGGANGANGPLIGGGGGGGSLTLGLGLGDGGGSSGAWDGAPTGLGSNGQNCELRVATAEFSLRSLCEMNPTVEVVELLAEEESEDVGVVTIERAEPTDFGSHFCLKVQHETTNKLMSPATGRKVDAAVMQRRKVPRKMSLMPNMSRGLCKSLKRTSNPTIDSLFTFGSNGSGDC